MGKQSNTKNIIAKKATKSKASTKKISNSSKKTIVSSKAKPVSKTSKTSKSKNSGSTKAKVKSKKQKQKKNKKKGNSSDNEKALTKLNLQQLEELHKKEYWRHSKKLNWDGYSDEAGSVASGILEESICFDCGELTTLCDDWSKLVLCDGCEGEYHLECVNLDLAPRKRFICPRCVQDTREFEGINYNIKGFPIPKDKKKKRIICYSPSRPLYLAWEECVEKGFMVVSKVFSYEIMKTLTHGKVEQVSSFGRVSDKWVGIINEMESYTPNSSIRHITMRGDRYDIKLPDFLVKHLKLDELLQPILEKLRTIMGFPKPILRTHNIVFVPVGSQPQTWHVSLLSRLS